MTLLSHDETGGERDSVFEKSDHELMKLIRNRVNQVPSIPMTQIAAELGVDVDTLCAFIMVYKDPDNRKKEQRKDGPAPKIGWDLHVHEQRYAAWKRQHDGAAARLVMQDATLDPIASMEAEALRGKTIHKLRQLSTGKTHAR